jgi:hypothetical protein
LCLGITWSEAQVCPGSSPLFPAAPPPPPYRPLPIPKALRPDAGVCVPSRAYLSALWTPASSPVRAVRVAHHTHNARTRAHMHTHGSLRGRRPAGGRRQRQPTRVRRRGVPCERDRPGQHRGFVFAHLPLEGLGCGGGRQWGWAPGMGALMGPAPATPRARHSQPPPSPHTHTHALHMGGLGCLGPVHPGAVACLLRLHCPRSHTVPVSPVRR